LLNRVLTAANRAVLGQVTAMTVRILVFIIIAVVAAKLTFSGNLTATAVTDQIGIQAIRHVFSSM
jgi:uncharacterized membrane protein YtjA (UPF0391 family)